jgi:transposase InsO family protein
MAWRTESAVAHESALLVAGVGGVPAASTIGDARHPAVRIMPGPERNLVRRLQRALLGEQAPCLPAHHHGRRQSILAGLRGSPAPDHGSNAGGLRAHVPAVWFASVALAGLSRMHLTLKQETASPPYPSLARQQRAFDRFRTEYNEQRPHEALGQTPPAAHY